jgi:hypothetical protein
MTLKLISLATAGTFAIAAAAQTQPTTTTQTTTTQTQPTTTQSQPATTTQTTTTQTPPPSTTTQPTTQTQPTSEPTDQPAATQAGQVMKATAADIKAGVSVYDETGALVGKVDSIDADGAIVNTGEVRAEIPLSSFGKNDKGLVVSVSKADLDAQAKKKTKPKN